jgi:hypothetical protein
MPTRMNDPTGLRTVLFAIDAWLGIAASDGT